MSHDGSIAAVHAQSPLTRFGLNHFAADVSAWHARELPGAPAWVRVTKVGEEAGELVGAFLKSEQQARHPEYRPERDYTDETLLELADIIISAMGAAEALGVTDVDALVARRWADVGQRRIATAAA